ncbi:MAG: N,N-dimethylformamidase beta subunit family domain-containing protein [Acidimicrobiales bacterium]
MTDDRSGGAPGDASQSEPAKSSPAHRGSRRVSRRRFIGLAAAGGAVAAAALAVAAEESGPAAPSDRTAVRTLGVRSPSIRTRSTIAPGQAIVAPRTDQFLTRTADGVLIPASGAIMAENAKPGHLWWVTTAQAPRSIEGYASQVSAITGDAVTLFVNTAAASFHVEAYRMGYYGGIGGRLVWWSDEVPGVRQPPPALLPFTNTIECQWAPSITVPISTDWPPGAYLLKLVGSTGEQQFVPLCVRDDSSRAAVVIQHSVTTWQAYNRWGGYSLYYGNRNRTFTFTHDPAGGSYTERARVVSFDRPYDHDWASGAADFIGNEFPVIYQAERMGLDVTYWTDVDLHAQPQLLDGHRALVSLGHDEYWSAEMRDGATAALAAGVNLAFLGANACYRQIRFEPSPLGPDRHQICYKAANEDPILAQDPGLVTVNWPQAPVSRPESELIGSTYQDIDAQADLVFTDPSSWVLDGVKLPSDLRLPGVVQGEFDRYVPKTSSPTNLDVIAHSVVPNRGNNFSDITWFTVPGGGGVFATGNASWVSALSDSTLVPPNVVPDPIPKVTPSLLRIMENVYSVIGRGPASASQPSQGNWTAVYTKGSASSAAPDTSNAA